MLDERLNTVLNYVEGPTLLDIGSDHAYLPIQALKENIIKHAICGEVVEGPFTSSRKNVAHHNYTNEIEVRLGDGLEVVKQTDQIDTISICGMGGPLIASILEKGLQTINQRPKIVVQANTYTYPIRKILQAFNYTILNEKVVKDKHHYYEIIVAELSDEQINYTEQELKFGPVFLKRRDELFIDMLRRELEHQQRIEAQMRLGSSLDNIKQIELKISELKEVIQHEG